MTENETRSAGDLRAVTATRADGTAQKVIAGSAIVYNSASRDLGGFIEYIDPGSVRTTDWTNALLNHDPHFLLGTLRAGTLRLTDSARSLDYEVDVPDHRADVYELVQRGDIRDASFAFRSVEETWDWEDEIATRRVHTLDLYDVSAVQVGAYPAASSNTRALEGLAVQVGASLEEVKAKAAAGELRSFFKRSDQPVIPGKPASYYVDQLKALGIRP